MSDATTPAGTSPAPAADRVRGGLTVDVTTGAADTPPTVDVPGTTGTSSGTPASGAAPAPAPGEEPTTAAEAAPSTSPVPATPTRPRHRVVVVGGGPGGYEAALVAAQLGGEVTVVDSDGLGGSAVLTDCVPSKTLIATSEVMTQVDGSSELGVRYAGVASGEHVGVDLGVVNARVKQLAHAQSGDIMASLSAVGVALVPGKGRLVPGTHGSHGSPDVEVTAPDGSTQVLEADSVLLAVGATPRRLDTAMPDGERILDWRQLYDLDELPRRLVVVGSGVTGAEFASAYLALGCEVVLVSSRDRVLPGEDADAAEVLEEAFLRRGMEVLARARAETVRREGDGVVVTLADGQRIRGSHCLMAVGSTPNTTDLGLEDVGVQTSPSGHIAVDRVSRTSVPSVYAAGDCTGVFALASVAAMQGRIAMRHLLGDAVRPLSLKTVSSNIFTSPEIATVGWTQAQIDSGEAQGVSVMLPLATNPRAKMQGVSEGFVKLFARTGSGTVIGGVVVGPRASELIFPVTLAVEHRLSVDDVARSFTVYPSLSGSIAEAARRLHPSPIS